MKRTGRIFGGLVGATYAALIVGRLAAAALYAWAHPFLGSVS